MKWWKHISWDQPFKFKLKKPIRLRLERGRIKGEWLFRIVIGPGAGYIMGRTLYIGRYADRRTRQLKRCIGFTNNANKVPLLHEARAIIGGLK